MLSHVNYFLGTARTLQAEQCKHGFKLLGLPESSRISSLPGVLAPTSVTLREIRMSTKASRNLSWCPIKKLTFRIHSISHANQGFLSLGFKRMLIPRKASSSLLLVCPPTLGISSIASITIILCAFLLLFLFPDRVSHSSLGCASALLSAAMSGLPRSRRVWVLAHSLSPLIDKDSVGNAASTFSPPIVVTPIFEELSWAFVVSLLRPFRLF